MSKSLMIFVFAFPVGFIAGLSMAKVVDLFFCRKKKVKEKTGD